MAEFKNEFSWSFSKAKDFSACPRRYYWERYGSWGGWENMAPQKVKDAYRLKHMKNRYALVGIAVDLAVKEAVAKIQAGEEVTFEEAYKTARDYLVKVWYEHQKKDYEKNPKRSTCIRDLYFSEFLIGFEDFLDETILAELDALGECERFVLDCRDELALGEEDTSPRLLLAVKDAVKAALDEHRTTSRMQRFMLRYHL